MSDTMDSPLIHGAQDDRPQVAGVPVREEDVDAQTGLHIAGMVFRVCSAIIILLAIWQFIAWWMDRPPGGVGVGVLVGDTIRLVVIGGLLWGAGDLADLFIKMHHDMRAGRILLARQTYMIRQIGIANGALPPELLAGVYDRRGERDVAIPPREHNT